MGDRFPIEQARAEAARVRRERTSVLGSLGSGQLSPAEAVREPPAPLAGMDLWDVLLHCQGIGRKLARTVCERAHVWPHLRLRDLSEQQRVAVVAALPHRQQ